MRLDTVGWELAYTAGAGLWAEGDTLNGNPTISTTFHRGKSAAKVTPTNSLQGYQKQFVATAGGGPYWLRVYVLIHTAPNANASIIAMHSAALTLTTTVPVASIQLTTAGALRLVDQAGSTIGSDSSALSTDTWYRVDLRVDGAAASGSRVIEARLNGSVFASVTNSTATLSVAWWMVGNGYGNNAHAGTTFETYFDDLAICNSVSGPGEEGYALDCSGVYAMRPAGAGDTSGVGLDHTAGGGSNFSGSSTTDLVGAGAGSLYQVVGEAPISDSDWALRENSSGAKVRGALFTWDDPVAVTGLDASADTVQILHTCVRVGADANTNASTRDLVATIKSKASGTLGESGASGGLITSGASTALGIHCNVNVTGGTGWTNNGVSQGAAATLIHTPVLTCDVSPHSGSAWTITGSDDSLTSLQAGWRPDSLNGSTTAGYRVSAMWMVVEVTRVKRATAGLSAFAFTAYDVQASTGGPWQGLQGHEVETAHAGTSLVWVAKFGDQASETETAYAGGDYAYEMGEVSLADLRDGAFYTLGDLKLLCSKAHTTDIGDIQIALRSGSTIVNTSAWTALTDAPTYVNLPITNPIPLGDDMFLRWWARRNHADSLTVEIGSPDPTADQAGFLEVFYYAVEVEQAHGQPPSPAPDTESNFFAFM